MSTDIIRALGIVALVVVIGLRSNITALAFDYQGFEIVDSTVTEVWGRDGDNIVGWHQVNSGPSQSMRGYTYNIGTGIDTDIDYPGADSTLPYDISGTNIVGTYHDGSSASHGFVYDGAAYSSLDYPGSFQTLAYGVDGDNVVGYHLAGGGPGGGTKGFLYDGTNWTTLSYPGSQSTRAYGIDGNKIVGEYIPGGFGDSRGFLYDGTTWTPLDYPGSFNTRVYGISGNNVVGTYAGSYGGQYSNEHAFVYDGNDWFTIDYPDSSNSRALGVDGDNIVGAYQGGPEARGYLTSRPVPPQEYIFQFTGEITEVDDAEGWFDGAFNVGQAVIGSYNTLDDWYTEFVHFVDNGAGGSNVIDQTGYVYQLDPQEAKNYGVQPAPARLQFQVGGQIYETGLSDFGSTFSTYTLRITDGNGGPFNEDFSIFAVQSSAAFPEHFINLLPPGESQATLLLSLNDSTGTAIDSFDLPITAPNLADYESAECRLELSDRNGQTLALMRFSIDSLSAVPEPSSLLMMSAIVTALTLRSRIEHKTRSRR